MHGSEVVLNARQQANVIWQLANASSAASAVASPRDTPSTIADGASLPDITVVNHGVAADPQTLARMTADELTWALRTRAA